MTAPTHSIIDTRRDQMFPVLAPKEIEHARRFGEIRAYERGEAIVIAGHASAGVTVVLSGKIDITERETLRLEFQFVVPPEELSLEGWLFTYTEKQESSIGMIRQRMSATWTDLQARAFAGETIPYERRTQAFYEATLVHDACSAAIYELMGVNGGRTMNANEALQRHFRDLLAMRNHPAANIELGSGLYAQSTLGVPAPEFNPSQRFFL